MGIFGFIYFAMLDTQSPTLIFTAVALSLPPVMTMYGPEAALIAELFSPRPRYSGASLGYQRPSILATAMLTGYTNKEISVEYEGV